MPSKGGDAMGGDLWEEGEYRSIGAVGDDYNVVEFKFDNNGPDARLTWSELHSSREDKIFEKDVLAIVGDGSARMVIDGRSYTLKHTYKILILDGDHGASNDPDQAEKKKLPVLWSVKAYNLPTAFQQKKLYGGREKLNARWPIQGRKYLHIVISTAAGTGLAQSFFRQVLSPLLSNIGKSKDTYTVHQTQSAQSVIELTKSTFLPRAQEEIPQSIILLSGDGGIVDIINVILSASLRLGSQVPKILRDSEGRFVGLVDVSGTFYAKLTIGLLPFGTGNALASSLGINKDTKYGLSNLLRGSPRPLPLFKATFSPGAEYVVDEGRGAELLTNSTNGANAEGVIYGAVVCSWGFHASLVADSDTAAYRKHGAERFQMAAKEALYPSDGSEPHRYRARVSMIKKSPTGEGEIVEALERQEHMYVLATLVSNLEKDLKISPSSKPLDGQLRLVHFGPLSAEEVMRIMGLAYQGGLHVKEEVVGYEDVEGVRIDFENGETDGKWRRVCVDGKIIRVAAGGWMEVMREHRDVVDIVYADQVSPCGPEDKGTIIEA